MQNFRVRFFSSIKRVLPGTLKTCIWIVELTVGVSFFVLLLRYFNILPYISNFLAPVFHLVGLPGEAALAYVTGYFVNVYSAIAVSVSLHLDARALTILSVMILCSHSMIIETAVQKKTGSSVIRLVIYRTLSGIILAFLLNAIIPLSDIVMPKTLKAIENPNFGLMFSGWCLDTLHVVIKMVVLIFCLNILQSLLKEYGVMKMLSRFLKPLLKIFGLPPKCSFLWIIANVIGLSYGSAAMIEEVNEGKLTQEEIDLTNYHVCISHSNLEDLLLVAAMGAVWWILILSRWLMSMVLVWGYRAELAIVSNLKKKV
ncbi:MAG: nucleoside recognition domain-containing protein [Bacteroidales bacterium]